MYNKPLSIALSTMVLLLLMQSVSAQEDGSPLFIQKREKSFYILGHTRGFGMGFQQGRILDIYSTLFWQAEFATMKHPKEYKRTNESFPNTRTYSYGKLNRVYMFRGGAGIQRIMADKPYWGGVQVRYSVFAGVNLSIAEPMYLYILYYNSSDNEFYRLLERYDPDAHYPDNIHGRGPLGTGLKEAKLYPGGYLKGAFNFDYSSDRDFIRALEVGAVLDAFPKKIPIMAFAKNSNLYLTLYLALHIGNRE